MLALGTQTVRAEVNTELGMTWYIGSANYVFNNCGENYTCRKGKWYEEYNRYLGQWFTLFWAYPGNSCTAYPGGCTAYLDQLDTIDYVKDLCWNVYELY